MCVYRRWVVVSDQLNISRNNSSDSGTLVGGICEPVARAFGIGALAPWQTSENTKISNTVHSGI